MKMYTIKEVSELLEVSTYRVKKFMNSGLLIAERGPRRVWLISEDSLFIFTLRAPRYYEERLKRKIPMAYRLFRIRLAVAVAPVGMILCARKNGKIEFQEIEE